MAGKHRVAERTRRVAMVTAATATATAMTVGAAAPAPLPRPEEHYLRVVDQPVELSASVSPFGPPGSLPDVTGGAGRAGYDSVQEFIAAYERALAGINVPGGLGINIEDLLSEIPLTFLDDILDVIPIDLGSLLSPILDDFLGPLTGGVIGTLIQLLNLLGLTDAQGNITLSAVLGILGLDLSDPLNLASLNIPGLNIITPGEPFLLLKMLAGLDLGWTPGTANAVADAINETPYLEIGVGGLLGAVLDLADDIPLAGALLDILDPVLNPILGALNAFDLMDVRIPIVVGYGFGAMAAGSAYAQVLADLANQPRLGANGGGLLGSLTLLPMILANNVGRANGGMLARFYPLFDLLGIDVITPDVETTNVGTGIPILNTGIELGAANLVPIKIDATVQYQPFSDLAAWPNPVSLFNNLLAGTIGASYILRGVDLDNVLDEVLAEVGDTVGGLLNPLNPNPLDINIYLTLATRTLPLLEPLYLAGDALNMVSFGTLGTVPYRLANALAPALTSLVNLGYTDVVRNPDGTWTRTLEDADVATPFMSFPKINWGQAMSDVFNSLVNGFHKEFFSGNPTAAPPNVLENLGKLLGSLTGGLGGLTAGLQGGIDDLLKNLTGQAARQAPNAQRTLAAAAGELPDPDATLVTVSVDPDGDVSTGQHAADPDAPIPADSGLPPKHAAPEEEPVVEEPVQEEPAEEPVLEEPAVEEPAEEPVVEEPVVEEPAAEEPAEEPAAEVEEPAAEDQDETEAEKPAAKKNPVDSFVRDIRNALNPKKKTAADDKAKAGNDSEAEKSDTDKKSDKSDTDQKADKDAA